MGRPLRIERVGGWHHVTGRGNERKAIYREYVESAVREGLPVSPWERLEEQVVLGAREFLQQLRRHVKGDAREQRGVRRLASGRPQLGEVIATVEQIKGEGWLAFCDRYGDSGRDLVLYAGQRLCGMKLQELAAATGLKDYGAVSSAIRRFERLLRHGKVEQQQRKQLCQKYKNRCDPRFSPSLGGNGS